MHSAVMQNKKYIEFSRENTVEVIALGRLDEGVQKRDRKATAFKAKGQDGKEVLYMLEFPNLTYAEMLALEHSPAAQYNKSGHIPYTSIVDPWTLKEVDTPQGSAKAIMEGCEAARKALIKEHGKGVARKDVDKINDAEAKVKSAVAAKDFPKAFEALEKVAPDNMPEAIKERVSKIRESVIAGAKAQIDELAELGKTDPARAKKEITSLLPKLKGTGLEDVAKSVLASLNG